MTARWAEVPAASGRYGGGADAVSARGGAALVEQAVDGVQRMGGVKVGVGEQGAPRGEDLGVDAARGGRGGCRPPREGLAHSWVVTALTSV